MAAAPAATTTTASAPLPPLASSLSTFAPPAIPTNAQLTHAADSGFEALAVGDDFGVSVCSGGDGSAAFVFAAGRAGAKSEVWLMRSSDGKKFERVHFDGPKGCKFSFATPGIASLVAAGSDGRPFTQYVALATSAVQTGDIAVYLSRDCGQTFVAAAAVEEATWSPLSLAFFRGRLWLAFTGRSGSQANVYPSRGIGEQWVKADKRNFNNKKVKTTGPQLAASLTTLLLTFRVDNKPHVLVSNDGLDWSNRTVMASAAFEAIDAAMPYRPAACAPPADSMAHQSTEFLVAWSGGGGRTLRLLLCADAGESGRWESGGLSAADNAYRGGRYPSLLMHRGRVLVFTIGSSDQLPPSRSSSSSSGGGGKAVPRVLLSYFEIVPPRLALPAALAARASVGGAIEGAGTPSTLASSTPPSSTTTTTTASTPLPPPRLMATLLPAWNNRVRLLTCNVAQLPPRICQIGDELPRAQQIAKYLLLGDGMGPPPDIVVLQELFFQQSWDAISGELRDALRFQTDPQSAGAGGKFGAMLGLQGFAAGGTGLTGVGSGLFIASRFPMEAVQFHEYRNTAGVDFFSRKGLLGARLRLPDDSAMWVWTTHMQAGGLNAFWKRVRGPTVELRKRHVRFAHRIIRKAVNAEPDKRKVRGALFAGDFNIRLPSREFREALQAADGREFDGQLLPWDAAASHPGTCWDDYPSCTTASKRIDHVFSFPPYVDLERSSMHPQSFSRLSDHLAVVADIVLPPQGDDTAIALPPDVGAADAVFDEPMPAGDDGQGDSGGAGQDDDGDEAE